MLAPMSLVSGWLYLDKGNTRCSQPFLFALRSFYYEPLETLLADSLKTHFNHNQAPYPTKITPFKSAPTPSVDKHPMAIGKPKADIIIRLLN